MKLKLPQIKKPNLKFRTDFFKRAKSLEGQIGSSARSKLHLEKISRKDKALSAVGYFFITGLIIRLFKKNPSKYLDFHQRQSIVLFILFTFALLIPHYGFTVVGPIFFILMIANLIVSALSGTLRLVPR